jgi:hypothetical protein
MARRTALERLVDERVGQSLVGTLSVTVDRIAEEIAREALADETFRRTIRDLVRRRSQEVLTQLFEDGKTSRKRRRRTRRRSAR